MHACLHFYRQFIYTRKGTVFSMINKPNYKASWSFRTTGNSSLTHEDFSRHFYFWNEDDSDMPNFDPSFSSPHVNVLGENQSYRALARLDILLKICNGIRIVGGLRPVNRIDNLTIHKNNVYRDVSIRVEETNDEGLELDRFSIYLEELENPFDQNVSTFINSTNYYSHISELKKFTINRAVEDPMVRNILIWRTLCEEDDIHFITNAYKIYETIKFNIDKTGRNEETKASVPFKILQEKIKEYHNKNGQYMNGFSSSGTLARHGYNSFNPVKIAPTFKTIKEDTNNLIKIWLELLLLEEI